MFFVSEEHEANYNLLLGLYKVYDTDYKAACYLLGLPEIYKSTGGRFGEYPFDWMYKFKEVEKEEVDFWTKEKRVVIERLYEEDENGKEVESEAYGTLSSGYRKIVELGRNLFNSSNEFNLCDALGTWDSTLFEVFQQAVMIRREIT
ncbi:DUF2538 family protein [Paenibacillus larvae]|uniref:DUF2538 family protein n=1 Tax=Paenibacillus larvae TaxID=1464 RepID=UPI00227E2C4B|nr:DUF2538 family protein [Paenibacillus larvae]MCY9747954.1 DUF2538 family protein [Paenibacillus larvae]MCY9750224.1 DUF2538 family protein [Paenibacillus larvae]